ncbi:hypothetical protein ACH5RR_033869 [Cinchona calisaya]|uniref:Uncharacterized protein n=1 Tax=Cinchona calisaya TaxID=153742 RepID=A0ABD2Y982_9GENT
MAIHSSCEHKSTKKNSPQKHLSMHHETRKKDTFDTSIKSLNDTKKMIIEASNKETKVIPTKNPRSPLMEKEVNVPNGQQPSKMVDMSENGGKIPFVSPLPKTLNATIGDSSCNNICGGQGSSECTTGCDHPWN